MKDISKAIHKVDSDERLSGQAKYTDDYVMENMLYAKTVRATVSKGSIKSVTFPDIPEGYFVVGADDVKGENVVNMIFDDWPVFTKKHITYLGEPLFLIVGPDKATINEIIETIKVDLKEDTPTFDFTDSATHRHFEKGNPSNAFKKTSKTIERTYETGYQEQAYIEPQGFLGYPEKDGVTMIGSIQCPYYVKNAVMRSTGLGEDAVRIIQADVGGAFGGKEEFPSLMACQLAAAVQKTEKPVKLIYERSEDMAVTTKRHPSKIKMKAYLNEANTIKGLKVHVSLDGGAYIGLSKVVLSRAMIAVSGAYTFPHLDVSGDVYKTNTVPNGAFRGFGAPQMLFAIEMFIEHVAREVNEAPFEYRMHHLAKQGDLTSTGGTFRDPIILNAMIKKAKEASNYDTLRDAYKNKSVYKGIGMSLFLHGCGFTGSGEADIIKAKVKLKKDEQDDIHILIAAVDMGQGPKTTLRKVVSDILDVPMEKVHYPNPDTLNVPDSGPTVASRTAMIVGGLCARAAEKLKKDYVKGKAQTVHETYVQPKEMQWDEDAMQGDAYPAYSWGVNIVEVEVDKETYQVDVKKMTSVYDIGKALDEKIIEGQIHGGQAQGLGYGYLEVMNHKNGRIEQTTMTDYIIPTSVDMPPMKSHIMDNPYALGPYGAKGAGELTLVGGAPALAKAVEQAIGKDIHKIPLTPESIMELMHREKH